MNKSKFKIGDKVKGVNYEGKHCSWYYGMKDYSGKEGKVTEIVECYSSNITYVGLTFKDGVTWYYPEEYLVKPVDKPVDKSKLSPGDIDTAWAVVDSETNQIRSIYLTRKEARDLVSRWKEVRTIKIAKVAVKFKEFTH